MQLTDENPAMIERPGSALVIARPGPLRDGLRALMTAMPQIGTVYEVNELSLALDCSFDRHLSVVLVDGDLAHGEIYPAVRRVKIRWPQAECVFMINDVHQQEEAQAAGADLVLLKGFPAAGLVALITRRVLQRLTKRSEQTSDGSLWKY